MRYEHYDLTVDAPNIVVDGSPNAGTVLCLTHWPGIPSPPGLADDLSAQMAFRYLDSAMDLHGDADVVTNNHFDQDGLVAVFALTTPDVAMRHRPLLEDLAAAGDFGTYRDRRAARLSAVVSVWALGATGDPYPDALEQLPHVIDHLDEYRDLWIGEDERLDASEAAVASGRVKVVDEPELDIAVVTVEPDVPWTWGARFAGRRYDGVHPMAVNNATHMSGIALVHGRRYRYTDRYETWVQYQSRERRSRVALLPLARRLTQLDTVKWRSDAVGDLTPTLSHGGESSIPADDFLALLREHLTTAPPAWDPAVGRRAGTGAGG